MDLIGRFRRSVFSRPHVFVLAFPGAEAVRLTVERELQVRGWFTAASPADTDLLLVVAPVPDLQPGAAEVVERFWRQVPQPRARAVLTDVGGQADVLDQGRADLVRAALHPLPDVSGVIRPDEGDMMMPAGLPLADEADDRDGLRLDALHIGLGPALPWWPAGLLVRLTIHGDVITEAAAGVIRADRPLPRGHPIGSTLPPVTVALDALTRLLRLAGAQRLALTAQRMRDTPPVPSAELLRFNRQVRRCALLRSMLSRIPLHGAPAPVPAVDVWGAVAGWLDVAGGGLPLERDPAAVLEQLPALLRGRELAEARLIIAAMNPDTDEPLLGHPAPPVAAASALGHRHG